MSAVGQVVISPGRTMCKTRWTRQALTSILGPFWVHLLIFTLVTPFLHTFFFSLPTWFTDALFGFTGISGWNLWCITHITTHNYVRKFDVDKENKSAFFDSVPSSLSNDLLCYSNLKKDSHYIGSFAPVFALTKYYIHTYFYWHSPIGLFSDNTNN